MTRSYRAGRVRAIVTAFFAGALAMSAITWALRGTSVSALRDDCGDPADVVTEFDPYEE